MVATRTSVVLLLSVVVWIDVVACRELVVIGAGVSGLSAARHLVNNGHHVTILEARPDRYGGRIWTHTLPDGSVVDLGASWIHGSGPYNPITLIAEEIGVPLVHADIYEHDCWDEQTGQQFNEDIVNTTKAEIWQMYEDLYDNNHRYTIHDSMYHVMDKYYTHIAELDPLSSSIASIISEDMYGASYHQLSAKLFWEDLGLIGKEHLFPGGYRAILERIVSGKEGELPLNVTLNKKVTKISRLEGNVEVTTGDGSTYEADGVIVTLPVGILKERTVTFDPPLSEEKVQAIQRAGSGLLSKVVFVFNEVFWNPDFTYIVLSPIDYNERGLMTGFLNQFKLSGSPVLMTFSYGTNAWNINGYYDEQVKELGMKRLKTIFGEDAMKNVTIIDMIRHNWFNDPYARVAYTYPQTGSTFEDFGHLATPACPGLYFAGEHTTPFIGTVHGSYMSGQRAAEEAMNPDTACPLSEL